MQIKSLLKQFSMVSNMITDYRLDEMRRRQERDDILLLSQFTTALHMFKCKPINANIKKKEEGEENKTISDGGITIDFSIIKVHTSN